MLEIKNPDITKGRGAHPWLDKKYDFILGVGDDSTDEELFQAMPMAGYSIKVGRGLTSARYRVSTHRDILRLLQRLSA